MHPTLREGREGVEVQVANVLLFRRPLGRRADRKSNIYSDRPRLVMASEILTGGIFMVFSTYNDV